MRLALTNRIGSERFALWFGTNVRLGFNLEEDSLVVRVPDTFFRDWIERHYTPCLIDAVEVVLGRKLDVSIEVDSSDKANLKNTDAFGSQVRDPNPLMRAPTVIENAPADSRKSPVLLRSSSGGEADLGYHSDSMSIDANRGLARRPSQTGTKSASVHLTSQESTSRPLHRLSDFVTGAGNLVAFAAATEVARTAGSIFNPLMIHGAIGIGKTHLLEGINHSLREFHPPLQVIQLNAEAFTNSFLDSMRSGTLSHFRTRLRSVGSLIVDDVQFLAAKRATMVEFLYTFDALYDRGIPIILAADHHPRQIPRLTDELVTRFLAGLVVRIEAPDLPTRQAILRSKAMARGIELPEPVVAYIAENLRPSIRELEGALHTLIAQSKLMGRCLDLRLAQSALRDFIHYARVSIGIREIEQAVCDLFQVNAEALRSESRTQALAYPRMIAMFLCRKHVGAPYSEIGRVFGGRSHATVIAAERKVNKWLKSEQRVVLLPGFETVADLLLKIEHTLGVSRC